MNQLDELFKKLEYYDHLRNVSKVSITPIPKPRNPRKVGQALTGKKADSSGKFLEKKLIFLLAFIFMICLANLITILFLINIFL